MIPDQNTPRPVESAEEERLAEEFLAKFESDGYRCCETCGQVAGHYETKYKLRRGFLAGYAAARTALALSERKVQRMREILEKAAPEQAPTFLAGGRDGEVCAYCRACNVDDEPPEDVTKHYADCPWRIGRQLLTETQSAGEGGNGE